LMGYPPGKAVRSFDEFISRVHPDDRHLVEAAIERTVEDGSTFDCEYRTVWPDGSIHWLAARGQMYNAGGGRSMHGVIYDTTDRKQLEQTLQEVARRKDEFLAMLGHELRNPLAPMRSATEVLRSTAGDDERLQRIAAILERQVTHMRRLVDDLLDVARVTQGKISLQLQPLDLGDVVRQASETVRPQVERQQLDLRLSLAAGPVRVLGDSIRLVQVFVNLLSNAIKFTPPHGRISVQVEQDRDMARVQVRDTGMGIAPDMLEQVFGLFVQQQAPIDRQQAGLGLGLTLVRALVEGHGGRVAAHSEGIGRGSTFTVALPLAPEIELAPSRSAGAGVQPRRILLVEDNEDGAAALAMLLEMQGHTVEVAPDGLTALRLAREMQPQVAFIDIGLPGIDGYEVARRLRADAGGGACLLIALSGYGQSEDKARAEEAGFDRHLTKPVEPNEIDDALQLIR